MKHRRKLIFICTGSDCKKCGAKKLSGDLKEKMSKEPFKGGCKLVKTKCMDMCKSAPVLILGEYFIKKASLASVLERIKENH